MQQPAVDTIPCVTAYLCAKGAAGAIEFYERAFGAEEVGERKSRMMAELATRRSRSALHKS